jgi:hypothetical protein
MPGVTTADVTAALKEVYGTSPADQLNHEIRALQKFDKSETAQWLGEVFVESLHTGRNYSTKAVAEGGQLPDAGKQTYEELRIADRYIYGTIEVTAQFMSEVKGKGSFVNGLDREINGMIRDLKVSCNRHIWGDGRGVLALVNDPGAATMTGGSTTVPIDSPMGIAGATNGARFLRAGMIIGGHAAAPANNTPLVVRTVSSIAADGTSIVIDASADQTEFPDNGVITVAVSRGGTLEGSWQLEPMGILGIIDDGTFVNVIHGLNRTTVPLFKTNVFSSVGDLDELIFWRALDTTDEMAGAEPDWFVAHHSVHREYIKISLADKRYSGEALMRPDVGVTGGGKKHELTFSGTAIEKERYAPYGFLYGIDTSKLKKYVNVEGKWVDEDGAILHRGAGNTDSFKATYRKFGNYASLQSNSSFILKGINSTIDVVNAN